LRTGPLDFRDGPSRRGGDVRYRNLVRRVGGAKRSSRQRLQKSAVHRFASDGRMEAGLAGIVTVGQGTKPLARWYGPTFARADPETSATGSTQKEEHYEICKG
jgi:hypothetical protein